MHCLRLFIAFSELHCLLSVIIVVCLLKSMCIPSFVLIGYCVHGHICPYPNYAIYCSFTRTTLVCIIRVRG